MNHTFYKYVLTFRGGPKSDKKASFAEEMFYDHTFPKHTNDFEELSRYIEELANPNMPAVVFDELWSLYETNVGFDA